MSSKKIRIVLISMLVLLGLAGGGFALVDHQKKQEEQAVIDEANSLKLFNFDQNTVNRIDVTNSDGYFSMSLSGGEWTLTDTDYHSSFPVNSFYLNSIATTMSELTALQKFEGKELAAYGLDTPVTITCHAAGMEYTLLVGKPSATQEYYYVSVPDSDTVYGIKYSTGEALHGGISFLHDPYVLHVRDADICSFKMERFGETAYDLYTDNNGRWQIKAPVTDVSIDTVNVSTILTDMVQLNYESFVAITKDPQVLAQYGLDKPAYYLSIGTDTETEVFEFPDYDPNDSVVYVYEPATGTLGTISASETAYLTGSWTQLLDNIVMRIPYADAASLDVTVDGKHFTMTMDHENARTKLDDIDITALDTETNKMFEYLYASVSEIALNDARENPELPENPVPTCEFRYILTDGTERDLSLVPLDDVTYWAYIDGKCVGQTVRRNTLSGASGVLSFLEKMTDALEDQGITYAPAAAEETTPEIDAEAQDEPDDSAEDAQENAAENE